MTQWSSAPDAVDQRFDATSVVNRWSQLHAGDLEPVPKTDVAVDAWVHFHNGDFQKALELGMAGGSAGLTVANKAACVWASYFETREKERFDMYFEVARRADAQARLEPDNVNAHFWQAYALGRYSQSISLAKALAEGMGSKIKGLLEMVIELAPDHSDAHIALGVFHAEVINKLGMLIGGMTFGVNKDKALQLCSRAIELNPHSLIAKIEHAHSMLLVEGDEVRPTAHQLYQLAANTEPYDALDRLERQRALAALRL